MDDDITDAPPSVIGAVALGVAPLPFLAVYSVLFIARGTVHPVIPPDIGNSKGDELVAGIIAVVAFLVGTIAAYWLLDGRRRWLFVLFQAATLGTCIFFVIDSTTGSPAIPIALIVTSLTALVLAFLPATWKHLGHEVPSWLRRDRPAPADAPDVSV